MRKVRVIKNSGRSSCYTYYSKYISGNYVGIKRFKMRRYSVNWAGIQVGLLVKKRLRRKDCFEKSDSR